MTESKVSINQLKIKTTSELFEIAKKMQCVNEDVELSHRSILIEIIKKFLESKQVVYCEGTAEVLQDGYAFLRYLDENFLGGKFDIYVSGRMVKKYNIRSGDSIVCTVGSQNKSDGFFPLDKIVSINDKKIKKENIRKHFDAMTPIYPEEKINLSDGNIAVRLMDVLSPMGKGQRGLIVAPPKVGKTTIMKSIAEAIEKNHPEIELIVLLVDERPEEVTDMKNCIKSDVFYSTFDEKPHCHIKVAEMVIERAKRMVEEGKDVVILFDSITRLARAYNTVSPSSGRVLSGGVEANALQKPKKFFGSARNTREAGSLTILATSLVETGSKMDEVIFEEFKSTGNMELVLSRALSEKRIFPAISVSKSGTRREELMLDDTTMRRVQVVKKILSEMGDGESITFLIKKLGSFKDNGEFFDKINS